MIDIGKADLHIHTRCSDGSSTPESIVDHAERNTNLDIIAITDHERIKGGLIARDYARRKGYRLKVIVGTEVTCKGGTHLLGLFLTKPVRVFMPLDKAIDAIHAQGGLAIAPHPLNKLMFGINRRQLAQHHKLLDGLEVFNAIPFSRKSNAAILELNSIYQRAAVAGSDAHLKNTVNYGVTEFPGSSPEDLRKAILAKTTVPNGRYWKLRGRTLLTGISSTMKAPVGAMQKIYFWGYENILKRERIS